MAITTSIRSLKLIPYEALFQQVLSMFCHIQSTIILTCTTCSSLEFFISSCINHRCSYLRCCYIAHFSDCTHLYMSHVPCTSTPKALDSIICHNHVQLCRNPQKISLWLYEQEGTLSHPKEVDLQIAFFSDTWKY